jgi:hypothetical protein
MAKSFYKLPAKEIKAAINELVNDGVLVEDETGWMLKTTYELIQNTTVEMPHSVYVLHRNDFLVKSNEHWLKEKYKQAECDILQYILIDGEFKGAVVGHFKNGPYVIEDIVLDLHDNDIVVRKDEIIEAVYRVNHRDFSPIQRFMGKVIAK